MGSLLLALKKYSSGQCRTATRRSKKVAVLFVANGRHDTGYNVLKKMAVPGYKNSIIVLMKTESVAMRSIIAAHLSHTQYGRLDSHPLPVQNC